MSDIVDPNLVPVTFVNELVVSGAHNGVVNLTFAVARFSPDEDGKVHPDLAITSRLRMDLYLATVLRDRLSAIIEANTKPTRTTEH